MPFPTTRYQPQFNFVRRFLVSQRLFIAVGLIFFAIVWITNWRGADFGVVLLYSVVVGNLTMLAMKRLAPLYTKRSFPSNWLMYLVCLFVVALASATVAVILLMLAYRVPRSSFPAEFWRGGRVGVVVVLISGAAYHLYTETRAKLENRNIELQRTVDLGKTQSQQQEQELGKAREIQEGLLPKQIPQIKGLETTGAWKPARIVGGDYFDVLKFNDARIGICIGDVVGKGITAALLMASLQATFRAFASDSVSAGKLLEKLNGVICSNIAEDKFITFCYCTIDAPGGKLTYANAGHCQPLLVRSSGETVPLDQGGPPLGIFPGRNYATGEARLEPGDRLVLYTDGLSEAMTSEEEEFGTQRLMELGKRNVARSAPDLLETIMKAVGDFSGNNFHDDLTLVVVAVK